MSGPQFGLEKGQEKACSAQNCVSRAEVRGPKIQPAEQASQSVYAAYWQARSGFFGAASPQTIQTSRPAPFTRR